MSKRPNFTFTGENAEALYTDPLTRIMIGTAPNIHGPRKIIKLDDAKNVHITVCAVPGTTQRYTLGQKKLDDLDMDAHDALPTLPAPVANKTTNYAELTIVEDTDDDIQNDKNDDSDDDSDDSTFITDDASSSSSDDTYDTKDNSVCSGDVDIVAAEMADTTVSVTKTKEMHEVGVSEYILNNLAEDAKQYEVCIIEAKVPQKARFFKVFTNQLKTWIDQQIMICKEKSYLTPTLTFCSSEVLAFYDTDKAPVTNYASEHAWCALECVKQSYVHVLVTQINKLSDESKLTNYQDVTINTTQFSITPKTPVVAALRVVVGGGYAFVLVALG